MTAEEIVSELRAIRYARVTMLDVAQASGLARSTVYDTLVRGIVSPNVKDALERGLQSVRSRSGNIVRFPRSQ